MSIGNGLANRFLLVWSTRSQLLPEDSVPDPEALRLVGRRITNAVDRARRIGHISWSDDARIVWASEYAKLAVSDTPDPRLRALFERAAPMVRRIAMIFALLDGTGTVGVVHLDAALAVWRYSADSWRMVFAEEDPRSPLARKLEAFIRDAGEAGLSRTQLRKLVGSNDVPADSINAALLELSRAGQAQVEKVRTRGRSCEIWRHARYVGAVRAQVAIEAPEEEWEEREQSAEVSPVKVLNPAFLPLLPSIQPEPLLGR